MKDDHLRISVTWRSHSGKKLQLMALIDTGAQVYLVRQSLLEAKDLIKMEVPMSLVTANQQPLAGGAYGAQMELLFRAHCEDTKQAVKVQTPTLVYAADIAEDVILSYTWLGERSFLVNPKRHGLLGQVGNSRVWIPGTPSNDDSAMAMKPMCQPVQIIRSTSRKKNGAGPVFGHG